MQRAAALLSLACAVASAYDGWATHFDAVGATGGCGITEAGVELTDTPDYVALNVQDSYHDYVTTYNRPIDVSHKDVWGVWNNGKNCGRYMKITIGDYCNGVSNSGNQYEDFCNVSHWIKDEFNGATLELIATDSCYDGNAWCRDDRYHIDIRTASLDRFKLLNGSLSKGMLNKWNNRRISWEWVIPSGYSGDISVGFFGGTKQEVVYLALGHLPNGVHGVERYLSSNNSWVPMPNFYDLGQIFWAQNSDWSKIVTLRFRVYDVNDQLIMGGREYEVDIPSSEVGEKYRATTYRSYGGTDYSSGSALTPATDDDLASSSYTTSPVTTVSSSATPVVVESSAPADDPDVVLSSVAFASAAVSLAVGCLALAPAVLCALL